MSKTLTNRMGLPQGILRAVLNDPYNSGECDISVTRLIAPAYQRKLMEDPKIDQVEDVSDRIWSLIGQATHNIIERAYPAVRRHESVADFLYEHGYLTEERLFTECEGWRISGAFDAYEFESKTMFDYKVTSSWSVIGDTKIEWEQQLNLLRLLAIRNGLVVDKLCIVAILRDWSKTKAKTDSSYPQAQVVVVDIPVWDISFAEEFLATRVRIHQDPNPSPCTFFERWQRDDVYAVMKEGRKSAVKLHSTAVDADAHAETLGKGHSVVLRPGESVRCEGYCSVSHACPYRKESVPF